MKKISILLIVLMCMYGNILHAQVYTGNITHKSKAINVSVIDYPLAPLGEEYKTYASEININNNNPDYFDFITLPCELIEDESKADLVLKVMISEPKVINSRLDTLKTTIYGKTETSYRAIANIECQIKASLFDNIKNIVLDEQDGLVVTEWKDFGMSMDAAAAIFRYTDKILSRALSAPFVGASKSFSDAIVNKYVKRKTDREVNFYYLSNEKFYQTHFDYYHLINLEREMDDAQLDKPLSERILIAEEYIEHQLLLAEKYAGTNYNETRIKVGAYYNSAAVAFLIDRFDEAQKYIELARGAVNVKYNSYEVMRDIEKLNIECDIADKRLKANNKANSFNQ